jgi:hypothetical protein
MLTCAFIISLHNIFEANCKTAYDALNQTKPQNPITLQKPLPLQNRKNPLSLLNLKTPFPCKTPKPQQNDLRDIFVSNINLYISFLHSFTIY